jgi:hypothetical protein
MLKMFMVYLVAYDEDGEGYNDFYVASVGSFVVRIKAMKQSLKEIYYNQMEMELQKYKQMML